jgi:hypothetical protein
MSRSEVIQTVGRLFRDIHYPSVDSDMPSIRRAATLTLYAEETTLDSESPMRATPKNPHEVARRSVLTQLPRCDMHSARWRINGHHAAILIWTEAEWDDLPERPQDAQHYPCGVWCALRMIPN